MEDSTLSDALVEEREELMVNPSFHKKKSHLLKPCSTSIDGTKALVSRRNRSDSSSLDLKALSLSVHFAGWRIPNRKFKSWATKMADLHKPIWRKARILEAVMASTNTIHKDTDLVLSVAEKWCPKTNTFVFPWGEATITLEDVMVLLGFSVLGCPVYAGLDCEGEKIKEKLVREWYKLSKDYKASFVNQVGWIKRFKGCGDELEHVAFLVLWLSYFVFPLRYYKINRSVFSIAVHLSRGTRIALAPAVLAHLYSDLSLLKIHITAFAISKDIEVIDLTSLFKLVEVWTWERFREVQPLPNVLLKGEPRLALWHDQKYKTRRVRQVLDYSKSDGFEWRPYTKTVKNWGFPKFYPERAKSVLVDPNLDDVFVSFARCLKVSELVGIGCVEHYFPDRVASQFGMIQDVPGPVKRKKLSQKEAWNEYSKPIDDLTLYIPSRSATGCDTQMFKEWRRKSCTSEKNLVVEADEALKPRNMTCMRRENMNDKRLECRKRVRGDYENSIVPSSSKMKRTSENVRKVAANFINKRRKYLKLAGDKRRKYVKRAHGNDESTMAHCQKQITIDNDEDSDSLTVSQLMKKYNNFKNSGEDACEWLGEKIKLEEDINDSGLRQKPERRLLDDSAIIREKASSGDAVGLIQKKFAVENLASKAHNNEPASSQKLANGDERSTAYRKSMVLSPSDESNTHIAVGGTKLGQDRLYHDNVLRSEETRKTSEQLQDLKKRKEDDGEVDLCNDPAYQKSLQNLQEMSDSIEKSIEEAKRNVAWLKEQKAKRQRYLAASRLI